MPTFTESNTVEAYIRDLLCGPQTAHAVAEARPPYSAGARYAWRFTPASALARRPQDVFVEADVRAALIRLNPAIAAQPARADEVLYKLRAIMLSVRSDGLIRANELFTQWLRNEQSLPFGARHEHVSVRLIDYDNPANNDCVLTTQYIFRVGHVERRADVVLLVNGFPLVIVEAKTPVRAAVSWADGALQLHADYEKHVPELFVCNVFNVATEGKQLRYGAIHVPPAKWGPWLSDPAGSTPLTGVGNQIRALLRPDVILDILAHFTLFATDKQQRRSKIVCRYQQYEGANEIVRRVLAGRPRQGLIWHFQGSGKSLLMVFAAQKLRLQPALRNPTVLIVVDRVDLDAQISGTFYAADVPNLVKAESRAALEQLLAQDIRKIILTTIFKFGEVAGELNARDNVILLVDEAHRTQEGDLGIRMRAALPNAFFFGLTGTPINRRDRNTFYAFGAPEDSGGYLSRYGFEESIRDGATLPLHFEPRLVHLHIDKDAIDSAYAELTGGLSDLDREQLARTATRLAVLLKAPDRIAHICADIAQHFESKVAPGGLKGMVVTFDQESCLLYKEALDRHLPPEASDIVISTSGKERDDTRYRPYSRSRDAEEALLDRFRDPNDPLQLLIVTAKLLTGFDAPILQVLYLDKPLRDHTLLQAITRVNRTYGAHKTHGLIVDYLGAFDDVAGALDFDEASMRRVVSDIANLRLELPGALGACLAFFPGVDRSVTGYEGLIAAQECLPDDAARDAFAAAFSRLAQLWEALSPDPLLARFEADYRWLAHVYASLQPTGALGTLIWHALGPKTIELIHRNVTVEAIRDDLETIVLDAEVLDAVLNSPNPDRAAHEMEIKIVARLRRQQHNPRFRALSERLEQLKARHEAGQYDSLQFLKQLLELARDVVQAEKETPPAEDEDRGKAALTALFEAARTPETPIVVERVVADIDEIVRVVRFPGWQATSAGEREVRKVLRSVLFKYRLHQDGELYDKAYAYIRQYY